MTGDKHLRFPKGFSAAELLVVAALFSLMAVLLASTFLNFTRLHRRVVNAEVLGEELRFVTELLVRAARNYPVEYPGLPSTLISPSSTLALDTPASTMKITRFASTTSPCSGVPCLGLSLDNGVTWTAITSQRIPINRFSVYVTPLATPFEQTGVGTYNNNNQPRITFLIDASYFATSTLQTASASIQTSVSSRVYVR